MKKLSNLNGVKTLSKKEQTTINGGVDRCLFLRCTWRCVKGRCVDFNEM